MSSSKTSFHSEILKLSMRLSLNNAFHLRIKRKDQQPDVYKNIWSFPPCSLVTDFLKMWVLILRDYKWIAKKKWYGMETQRKVMSRSCQQNRSPLRMKNLDVLFKAMDLDLHPRTTSWNGERHTGLLCLWNMWQSTGSQQTRQCSVPSLCRNY